MTFSRKTVKSPEDPVSELVLMPHIVEENSTQGQGTQLQVISNSAVCALALFIRGTDKSKKEKSKQDFEVRFWTLTFLFLFNDCTTGYSRIALVRMLKCKKNPFC